jgi:uncharacterized membrane protein YcaP (DUF421 family)
LFARRAREHGVVDLDEVGLEGLEMDGSVGIRSDEFKSRSERRCRHYWDVA